MDQLLLKQQMAQKLTPAPVGMKKVREDISVFKKIALGGTLYEKKGVENLPLCQAYLSATQTVYSSKTYF